MLHIRGLNDPEKGLFPLPQLRVDPVLVVCPRRIRRKPGHAHGRHYSSTREELATTEYGLPHVTSLALRLVDQFASQIEGFK